jgi:hypothetical protein
MCDCDLELEELRDEIESVRAMVTAPAHDPEVPPIHEELAHLASAVRRLSLRVAALEDHLEDTSGYDP